MFWERTEIGALTPPMRRAKNRTFLYSPNPGVRLWGSGGWELQEDHPWPLMNVFPALYLKGRDRKRDIAPSVSSTRNKDTDTGPSESWHSRVRTMGHILQGRVMRPP